MIAETLTPVEQMLKKICTQYLAGTITREELVQSGQEWLEDPSEFQAQISMLPNMWKDAEHDTVWISPFLSDMPEILHFQSFDTPQASGKETHMILMMPHQRYSPAFFHSHDYFEVIYVAGGCCLNIFPDTILEIKTNEILFLPPGQPHAISAFQDDCIVYNFLVRQEELSASLFDLHADENELSHFLYDAQSEQTGGFAIHAGTSPMFSIRIHQLFQDYDRLSPRMKAPFLSLGFRQMLLLLLHDYSGMFQIIHLPAPEASQSQLIGCIQKECSTITLGELAWRFGYNYEHVSRIIKRQTGSGFAELRRKYRMNKAASLLRETDMAIDEIITKCGYESRSSFFQNFREAWNMTPSHYRFHTD